MMTKVLSIKKFENCCKGAGVMLSGRRRIVNVTPLIGRTYKNFKKIVKMDEREIKKGNKREGMKRRRIANGWNSSAFIFRECFNANIAIGVKHSVARNFHGLL